MAEAPMIVQRDFPAANQLGIADGTVLNQSRLTFRGQRGLVLAVWSVQVRNPAAAAKSFVGLTLLGSVPGFTGLWRSSGWFDAVATRIVTVIASAVLRDPPDGSFMEVAIDIDAGTVDVFGGFSTVTAIAFAPGVQAGPVVTVS